MGTWLGQILVRCSGYHLVGHGRSPCLLKDIALMSQLPSTIPNDPWVVYDYEVGMLDAMCEFLEVDNPEYKKFDGNLRNAVVESALLHTRVLIELLLSRGHETDDIRLLDLLPTFQSGKLEQLRQMYGNSRTPNCPCWTLNKMLAHPTRLRSNSREYSALLNSLTSLVGPLTDEIDQHRPK